MTERTMIRTLAPALAVLLLAVACGGDDEVEPPVAPGAAGQLGAAGTSGGTGAPVGATAGNGTTTSPTVTAGANAPTVPGSNGGTAGPAAGTGAAAAGTGAGIGPTPAGTGATAAAGSGAAGTAAAPAGKTIATLYWLDINGNSVYRATGPDFMDARRVVMRTDTAPDGVSADVAGGKLYWTNMGSLLGSGGGTLQRANLDGTNVERIVASGVSRTPKQMQLDLVNKHVYWCDREGAKVWRAGLDGSMPEAIVSEHGNDELVGVALDVPNKKFYFGDRIRKKIFRANMDMPAGQTGANRMDIEELFSFSGNAMPIDLDIDHEHKLLYWTDRNLGTVKRAGLDIPAGATAATRTDAETVVTGLTEPIGISLDVPNDKMYYGELGGTVTESTLDGKTPRAVGRSGSVTGVAIVHVPAP